MRQWLTVIIQFLALILWGKELKAAQEVRNDDLTAVKDTINDHRSARDTADPSRVRDDDSDLFRTDG